MKNIPFNLVVLFCLISLGCKKTSTQIVPSLPAETHQGKNTFGFNLNRQLWLPQSKGVDSGPALSSSLQLNEFTLAANRLNQHLTFNIAHVTSTGTYDLTKDGETAIFVNDTVTYKCTEGAMNITYFDAQKGIISGVFSLKAESKSGESITIEQGRFDTTF